MSLIKLIDSNSFFKDEPQVSVINFDGKGLIKQAADSRINQFAASIKPDADKIYVHILALSAGEYFSSNRNGDFFTEQNLIDSHHTFVTSPAHIFRNHVNKRAEIAIGQVIFSIYNERMRRVEVVAWIDKVKGADIVERLERGNFPATSMACRTPGDTCSICGNYATTLQSYCDHLRNDLNKIYPDGRKVMALNLAPLTFFDMSIVVRPADVTSSVLQKLASAERVIGSAEAAEAEGITDAPIVKKATLKKLSELIKEVDGQIVDYDHALDPILLRVADPEAKLISLLRNFPLPEVATTLAHMGMSPSIAFLADLVAQATISPRLAGCGPLVESLLEEHGIANVVLPNEIDIESHGPITKVASMLGPYIQSSSLFPEHVAYRSARGNYGQSNVGYVGNGPHIEPTVQEYLASTGQTNNQTGAASLVTTLLQVGATALLMKWYISRQIGAKMREMADPNGYSGVKINLTKTASDYKISYQLAEASMIKALKK
jgi:hypothetical protein